MVYVILGTKAQLIKMAPVMKALNDAGTSYHFIFTAQHRETITDILRNFDIRPPDRTLYEGSDITSIHRMGSWATRILWKTWRQRKTIFSSRAKGIVLVHGDTFSTLLGALMGKIDSLKVGHIESGLRSFNTFHPFPEELTRIFVFCLSDLYFCPGDWAIKNLKGFKGQKTNTYSNTLVDALRLALSSTNTEKLDIPPHSYSVVSIHRFENIFSKTALRRIVEITEWIAKKKFLLFILHKPTEKKLREFGLYKRLTALPNIELRQRYDYFRFIRIVDSAEFVVSDGGSNQEECFYLGKPLLLLRKATERTEGLEENCVLSGYRASVIENFVNGYECYRRPMHLPEVSPSRIIADTCRGFS